MSTARDDPVNQYTVPFQLTKKIHRQVPDELQPERPENSQKGKIILITGGGTGIGAAAANVWVRAGAKGVVITGRRKDRLEGTAQSLKDLSQGTTKILPIVADIVNGEDMKHVHQEIKQFFGRSADVVMANAAVMAAVKPSAEVEPSDWWKVFQINVLGLHHTIYHWIKSQSNPKKPVGTVIAISTGMEAVVMPGFSAYSTSKLAVHKYMEFLALEYDQLRTFTLLPGLVATESTDLAFTPFSKDEAEQAGATALYLASPRADYLRGSLTSINWDVAEMEARKADIEKGMLKLQWMPVLPIGGGSGI